MDQVPAGRIGNVHALTGIADRSCFMDQCLSLIHIYKEEIGSVGATGMQSRFFENAVAELLDAMGCYSDQMCIRDRI